MEFRRLLFRSSTSAGFTSADAGKYIMIHGANGTLAGPLITRINSVTNATTAVLAAAATASVSNCPAVYGTDATAAINSAVTAAGSYATAGDYFAEVLFAAKIYILGTGPTQIGNGTTTVTFNSQVPLPYPAPANTTQKLVIALTGAGDTGYLQFWQSLVPNVAGTALVSMVTAPRPANSTFGVQSVIGGPTGGAGFTAAGGTLAIANVKVIVKGIGVFCPIWTNLYAFDFGYVSAMRAEQCGAHIFAPTGVNVAAIQPYLSNITAAGLTNAISVGWRTPVGGNNADVTMDDCAAEGYEIGFLVFDHFHAGKLNCIYCDVAVKWDSTQGIAGVQHGIFIQSITAEAYNGGFRTNGGSAQVNINWDAENSATPAYDINDAGGNLYGLFRFGDKVDNRAPIVAGAPTNLKIVNENLGPGTWAGKPAVPATGVAQQNTAWRDAMVSVTGGVVSAVTVDGTAVGFAATGFTVLVPAGKNITLTYSAAPSWDWVLM